MQASLNSPAHHDPRGGFRNPWNGAGPRGLSDLLRWQWQRWRRPVQLLPASDVFARAQPALAGAHSPARELRITWIGQSTFLLQSGGVNVLTDPIWSERASPFSGFGPARLTAPGLAFDALPALHAVLLSHDHYDHLDARTIRHLARAHPGVTWFTPLGYRALLRGLGVHTIHELDWWQQHELVTSPAHARFTALPAQHWTRRLWSRPNERLWCSWAFETEHTRVYFTGDSGYCPGFHEIGERAGPFAAALLPIGAYDPRWFMKTAHMNPEEAVLACQDVRARHFVAMHWATFRLTDEDPLEPPVRVHAAWQRTGLPDACLHVPAIGQTILVE